MNERSVDEAKAEANLLVQSGNQEEAIAILKALIERNPPSEDLYEDVIYNYLLGGAYPEAKELARRYEREFGTIPTPELSFQTIEEQEREQRQSRAHRAAGYPKVFRRLPLWERGDFSRYLPWSRVVWQEIWVDTDAIVLKKRLRTYRLEWVRVKRALLTKERAYIAGNFGYVLKLVVLRTAEGKTYKIDVSTAVPEFRDVQALEKTLRQHLTLEEGAVGDIDAVSEWISGLLLLLVVFSVTALLLYLISYFS